MLALALVWVNAVRVGLGRGRLLRDCGRMPNLRVLLGSVRAVCASQVLVGVAVA